MYFLFPRLAKKHITLTVLLATWQDFDVVDRNIKFLLRLYATFYRVQKCVKKVGCYLQISKVSS